MRALRNEELRQWPAGSQVGDGIGCRGLGGNGLYWRAEVLRRRRTGQVGVQVLSGAGGVLGQPGPFSEQVDVGVEHDGGLDSAGHAGISQAPAFQGGNSLRGAKERDELASGRIAECGDLVRVIAVLARVCTQPADGGLDVLDLGWEVRLAREAVVDRGRRIPGGQEEVHKDLRNPVCLVAVARDPRATVDVDHQAGEPGMRRAMHGQVQVEFLRAGVIRIGKIEPLPVQGRDLLRRDHRRDRWPRGRGGAWLLR